MPGPTNREHRKLIGVKTRCLWVRTTVSSKLLTGVLPVFQNLNYKLSRRLFNVLPYQLSHQKWHKKFLALGELHIDKLYAIFYKHGHRPINVATVHQAQVSQDHKSYHTSCRKKNEIPRFMVVEALSWLSRRASHHPAVQNSVHP